MNKLLRVSEFAERVGRWASTVRRWEREGLVTPLRTVRGQRYFTEADVLSVLGPGLGRLTWPGGGVLPGVLSRAA
jgi:putative resolvase